MAFNLSSQDKMVMTNG